MAFEAETADAARRWAFARWRREFGFPDRIEDCPSVPTPVKMTTDEIARKHVIEHHLQSIERHAKELRRILQEQS